MKFFREKQEIGTRKENGSISKEFLNRDHRSRLNLVASRLTVPNIESRCNQLKLGHPPITGRGLILELKFLNQKYPQVTNEIEFFEKLVMVRDSTIHADSKAEWIFGGKQRIVASKYRKGDRVEFTEAHLAEAIQKAVSTIGSYEHCVETTNPPTVIFPKRS